MGERMSRWTAAGLDAAAVLAFAVIGRSSHDEGLSVSGVAGTAGPFLIGLGVGWAAALALQQRRVVGGETSLRFGLVAAAGTVVGGLLLRRFAWDDGTAISFVIVTIAFVTAALSGWRAFRSSNSR